MVAAPGPVPVSARSEPGAASCWSQPGDSIFQFEPGAWPFSSHLELGALDSAVPCARLHARQVIREWGRPDLADSTELLVSELMTNAIRASIDVMSPAVALWLFSDGRCVVIQVWDGSSEMPVRQDADADSESGWGLLLVESLSRDWGSFPRANGKVVWARI
jgi:anti-sigma regulatory factor (Ser/Thr protein kinase)